MDDAFRHALRYLIPYNKPIAYRTNFKFDSDGVKATFRLDDTINKVIDDILKGEEKMIKNDMMKDINKIVITRDENDDKKVICRAFTNTGGRFTYDATCSPDDIFDFNIGAKLAMDRLYEGYDMTPKPKRKPYNGKIFVARYPGLALRDNTLYTVTNGFIDNCLFGRTPFIYEGMKDADLSSAILLWIYGSHEMTEQCVVYFVR